MLNPIFIININPHTKSAFDATDLRITHLPVFDFTDAISIHHDRAPCEIRLPICAVHHLPSVRTRAQTFTTITPTMK